MSQLSTQIHILWDRSSVHSLFCMKLVGLNTLFLKICFQAGEIIQITVEGLVSVLRNHMVVHNHSNFHFQGI